MYAVILFLGTNQPMIQLSGMLDLRRRPETYIKSFSLALEEHILNGH